ALRAGLHHGSGARQRVHGSDRRRLPLRPGGGRPRAVRDHRGGECDRSPAHRARGAAGHGERMTPTSRSYRRRRLVERVMFTLAGIATAVSIGILSFLLGYTAVHGVTALSLDFFTRLPAPVGEPGGGMANAIVGSAKILLVAALVGIPIGFVGGIYLAEYGRGGGGFWVGYAAGGLDGVASVVGGLTGHRPLVR